jgi:hypothetical protein
MPKMKKSVSGWYQEKLRPESKLPPTLSVVLKSGKTSDKDGFV